MLVLVLKIQVVWILDGKQDSELQRAFAVGNFSLEDLCGLLSLDSWF